MFNFLENEYNGIFVKKSNLWVPLLLTSLSLSLSLSLFVGGCHKKKKKNEEEDKVKNDTKQKKRWKQKISTRLEYRK